MSPPRTSDLGQLFEREGDAVFGFLLNRCGSRALAEDLTTETFLAAIRHLAADASNVVSAGWLKTVARRRLIDHWRTVDAQHRRTQRLLIELHRSPAPDEDPETGVDEALASLSERHRAVLVLRYLDDLSVSEVAEELAMSYKATESLLSRARVAFVRSYESSSL